jgi:hypothetical protein
VQTAFSNAVKGNLTTGNTTVAYAPSATLLSMKQIDIYGGNKATIQTWQITSDGSIKAARTAQVEVTAILETPPVPLMPYAAFATSGDCAAMDFKGNTTRTDSYDSTQLVGGNPNVASSGGNVGTNGNLTEAGGATINGSLSTPRVGIGNCSSGNVNALSSSGGATVIGGVAQLPQSVKEPDLPAFPNPPTGPINENGQTLGNGDSVGDVTVTAGATLTLCSNNQTCTITVNSIKLSGNSTLKIAPGATVILRVAGQSSSTPIDFTGGSVVASFSPDHFQIQYAGTGTIKVNGGANTAELIYAPNGAVQFNGGGDFYGAVIAATVTDMGGAKIHYDRHLSTLFFAAGNTMLSSFSWNKY